MARTIDERIVQMTFNNQEFEKRANTTIVTLGKLTDALNPTKLLHSMDGVQKAANSLDLSGVQDALYNVNKGFNLFEEIAVGACRKIGDAIATHILGGVTKVKQTISSLTTAQIGAGFTKYNDLTSSVQTLVNSTGKSVDEIDGYLKRLMWYSDETSFGFTDMTKALGTMVSSGGEIDNLIPLLMGVGNAVAYAGKGASEFSRVIYNLNQSYSSGALNTMDWRSIELAGADSKVLKEQLLGAAVELKKINKEQAKLSNFKDLLSKKVFDREVMEKAFGAFAQMTLEAEKLVQSGVYDTAAEAIESLSGKYEEFAERAFKSAQEAKSFREAIEATQDAVSSGWMQTFQLIFGNYEESKALWTDVTETFWDLFASGAEKRNKMFEEWKSIWTDTDKAVQIFGKPFEKGGNLTQTQAVINALSDAILALRDMFSEIAGEALWLPTIEEAAVGLFKVLEKIRKGLISFTEDLTNPNLNERSPFVRFLNETTYLAATLVQALFDISKAIKNYLIDPIAKMLKPVLDDIFTIFYKGFDLVTKKLDPLHENMSPIQKFLTNIVSLLTPFINLLAKAVHWVREFVEGIEGINIFDGVFKTISNIVDFFSKVVNGTLPLFKTIGDALGGIFSKIKTSIADFLGASGSDMSGLMEGGILGYLAYGIMVAVKKLKDFDIDGLLSKFTPKGMISGVGDGIKDIFTKVSDGINTLLGRGTGAMSDLENLAKSIMKLALAFLVLSFVDGDKIESSLIALGGVLTEAVATIKIMQKMHINNKAVKAMKGIALAMVEVALALKIMSSIDSAGLGRAFLALTGVFIELGAFMAVFSAMSKKMNGGNIKSLGKSISKIGFALIEISLALKIMSTLDDSGMKTALITMGAALAELAAFVIAISKFTDKGIVSKLAVLGPTMIGMGLALIEIAAAMKLLSTIDAGGVDKTLVALFGALGTIALFVLAITNLAKGGALSFVGIAAGLLIFSAAIGALTIALIALSAIGWNTLKEGLKVLIAMFAAIAVSGVAIGVLSPILLLGALALLAYAAAMNSVSESILKAITAFTLLQKVGTSTVVQGFLATVPKAFIAFVGAAITEMNTYILDFAARKIGSVIKTLIMILKAVLQGILDAATELLPLLFQIGMAIVVGLLQGFAENVGILVTNLLAALVATINALADAIRNSGELAEALGNLAGAIIEGLLTAIPAVLKGIGGGIMGGLKGMWESFFGEGDQKDSQEDSGKAIVNNVTTGMDDNKKTAYDKASEIGNQTAKEMEDAKEAEKSGTFTVDGLIKGLTNESKLNEIFNAGMDAGKAYMNGYNFQMDQHSPSRMMEKEAGYTLAGLINGLSHTSKVENAGETVGKVVYNAISSALSLANEIMDDSLNPVITPVLDLSEIQARKDAINGLFGSNIAYDGIAAVNRMQNDPANQNPTNTNNITVNATFEVNTYQKVNRSDVEQWSDWLVDSINTKLGEAI